MFLRSVISLTLSALLLSSVSQVAFASGHGGKVPIAEKDNKGKSGILSIFRGSKKSGSPASSQRDILDKPIPASPYQKNENIQGALIIESSTQGSVKSYVLNNTPPQLKDEVGVQTWINHYINKDLSAIDTTYGCPLRLTRDEIDMLFKATIMRDGYHEYVSFRERSFSGSLRTHIGDSTWKNEGIRKGLFYEYPQLEAVYFGLAADRPVATGHVSGKKKNGGASLIKYLFVESTEGAKAIINPDEGKPYTFCVNYPR